MPAEKTLMLSATGHLVQIEIGHTLAAIRTSRGGQDIYLC